MKNIELTREQSKYLSASIAISQIRLTLDELKMPSVEIKDMYSTVVDLLEGIHEKLNAKIKEVQEPTEETVTITKSEWVQYEKSTIKLNALGCAGVDNWSGYDERHEHISEKDKKFLDEN